MATTAAPAAEAPPADPAPAKGKKKLILIAAAALLVLLLAGGGGAAYWMLSQNKPHDAAAEDEEEAAAVEEAKAQKKKDEKRAAPVFLPLEMFTVNLADRDAERYAQVGVTLEVADTKTSDQLKAYMPALRNDVLMLLAHKRASELLERTGKLALAREIRGAALRALGDEEDRDVDGDAESPVRAVHFSSFIIQ